MSDDKQEGQKTIVSFIVGLLIGGLLVWAFSGPEVSAPEKMDDKDKKTEVTKTTDVKTEVTKTTDVKTEATTPSLQVGEGKVVVEGQPASSMVKLSSATYPVNEGWIGVRDYQNGQLGGLLGVSRFSEKQGLVPSGITLQRATVAGRDYAVVVYTESGDMKFNLAEDKQLDSVFATFTAQ